MGKHCEHKLFQAVLDALGVPLCKILRAVGFAKALEINKDEALNYAQIASLFKFGYLCEVTGGPHQKPRKIEGLKTWRLIQAVGAMSGDYTLEQ